MEITQSPIPILEKDMYNPQNPLIVQGDSTVLLEVDNGRYPEGRDLLARFAELEKSPEYIHTYRISPLSLWNAAAAGLTAEAILAGLEELAKYPLPDNVRHDIRDYIGRYGLVKLVRQENDLLLVASDELIITELGRHKQLRPYIAAQLGPCTLRMDPARRGHIKQALVIIGYPAEDLAGYVEGETLTLNLLPITQQNKPFKLRDYQYTAAATFHAQGSASGGSGVIVLPCGAGKTMVGMAVINQLQTNTLILTPSTVAARQWIDELLDKTSLAPEQVGEYTGSRKSIKPVTISTYQTMTFRKRGTRGRNLPLEEEFPHFSLFSERDWGLIVYDEVHLLPAPVFRVTAELQARRRLGLTATLVREDGQEEDVFSLIGPKKYDVPWRELEKQGWIATAHVTEVRIPLPPETRVAYAVAEEREKARIAAENPEKLTILDQLLARHYGDHILIIGTYLGQLEAVQRRYGFPLITGKTPVKQRQELLGAFRDGSKVGNFAIDLPEANVMIQISGAFGSRQEEAQRLGRILRPKKENSLAYFYTLVSKDSKDQEFSANRQRFLTEQGYRYHILYGDEVASYVPPER
ncbi:MAG TPA: DEAD/DEAH box helicase [Chloroflexota bacterium]|nr:DEAD/DEAH box helicase [Chloroflexota bacterium]